MIKSCVKRIIRASQMSHEQQPDSQNCTGFLTIMAKHTCCYLLVSNIPDLASIIYFDVLKLNEFHFTAL